MTVTAFAYAKTVVSDSDALTSFYAGALGFTAAIRIEDGEGDNRFVENFLTTGAGGGPAACADNLCQPRCACVEESIVAVMVDDVDETLAAIERAGGRTTVPAFDVPEHHMRMAYAADPEGHSIELMKIG
jgi:predicted enzyme related to lactoylglutathione lyase